MARIIEFEGRRIEVPADATDAEIATILEGPAGPPSAHKAAEKPTPGASGFIEVEAPDGTIVEFPAGTPYDVMTQAMRQRFGGPQTGPASPAAPNYGVTFDDLIPRPGSQITFDDLIPQTPTQRAMAEQNAMTRPPTPQSVAEIAARPPAPRTWGDTASDAWNYAASTGAIMGREGRRVIAMAAGAPVDLVNNLPRVPAMAQAAVNWAIPAARNLPQIPDPGRISDMGGGRTEPFGGSESIDRALGAPIDVVEAVMRPPQGDVQGPQMPWREGPVPQDAFQRVAGRIGGELGAAMIPAAGALAVAGRVGREGARQMGPVARFMVEPAAVDPTGFVRREAANAGAAGLGAGIANEAVGNPQRGDNFVSDFAGSMGGIATLGAGKAIIGAGGNALSALFGGGRYADEVAREAVASRIMANSSEIGRQMTEGRPIDTSPLVEALRRPSQAETLIPGYQANIADRTGDPSLATFAFNQDMRSPGAANSRTARNEAAVSSTMDRMAPDGDPAQFRAALQSGRDVQIAEATAAARQAEAGFAAASQQVQPTMRDATARGSSIRSALQDRADAVQTNVVQPAWEPMNQPVPTDVNPLVQRFAQRDATLPANDAARFRPAEADVVKGMAPDAAPAPVSTGLLDASGQPIMRQPPAPDPRVPMSEITAVRGGLSDDIMAAERAGRLNEARVLRGYRVDVDAAIKEALPAELAGAYENARALTRDFKDRFARQGTAIGDTLMRREGGMYALDDSAVPARFVQPDSGRVNDFRALMREVGTDPRARNGVADEILADVQSSGLLQRPEQLQRYMNERGIMLGEFPELRQKLQAAAEASRGMTAAQQAARETEQRLTTPGRSAVASYLKYADEATVDAVRTITTGPRPAEAMRELLDAAGNTPEAIANARAALWEAVKRQRNLAPGLGGEERWNGRKLQQLVNDPKFNAAARVLWRDNPEEFDQIRAVFNALAGSERSTAARLPGTSGTRQALLGGFDPALSAASVASRIRSVNRSQLSPSIAAIDLAATWLRRRSAQVQSRAIDTIASAAVNNPGMAATLLEEFNPADWAARRRLILQKYGVRATQLVNLLDEAQDDDPVKDAIMRQPEGRR
ncbi:hypothetical protein [Phreatobacter oligotrophus]|uniref:Uncharacterized protein n=1 Tax=Phreatobacter oligotrophus TaxID=1122261 RepID=A0A2T4Z252_9HYPH|nr:hypothetical protein [Phreatobacter oligotrophus]PTM54860.1 hypothetical protein C8P69_1058 [Phreatobacter oligotrophus]